MRALLDLMRVNEAAVHTFSAHCIYLLDQVSVHLKRLDAEHGEEELITSVPAELAKRS